MIHPTLVRLFVLAAASFPPLAAIANPPLLPGPPAPGLWALESSGSMFGNAGPTTTLDFCADGKSWPDPLRMGARREYAPDCQVEPIERAAGTQSQRVSCEKPAPSVITTRSRGNYRSDFVLDVSITVQVDGNAQEMTFKAAGTHKGACPAGMNAGDMRGPDGEVLRARKVER